MHTIFMIRYQIYCLSRYFFQNLWINTLYLSLKFSNFDCCLCLEHLLNLTEIWLQVKYRSFKCLLCKQSSFHDFVFKKVINKTLFHIQSNRLKMSKLPFYAYKIKRAPILSKGLYWVWVCCTSWFWVSFLKTSLNVEGFSQGSGGRGRSIL